MSDELTTPDATSADLRALVGGIVGSDQIAGLPDAVIRAASTVLLERMMFARQAGISFHGARDIYEVLGYSRVLDYRRYRAEYMRNGLARRVVDAYPAAVWREGWELFEDEDPNVDTELEKAWKGLNARLSIGSRLQRVHTLALLSTYSVLLIGASGDLSEELPRGKGPDSLLYLTPFSGGGGPGGDQLSRSMAMNADASIMTFEVDPQSPRFGMPNTYQLRRTDLSSPLLQRPVHWTRIIHCAHGLLGDEVYGAPILESVFNLFEDLQKVTGGGAEAFWLRAANALHVDFDKTMGLPPGMSPVAGSKALPGMSPTDVKEIREKAEHLQHQIEKVMVTRGATINQLSAQTADFKDPADAIITQIAGTIGIPKRILVGSEAAQLASGQDRQNWNSQVQDYRTSWAFPCLIKPLVDRLIQYNYLPAPQKANEYHVDWPVVADLTEDEKAKYALDLATVNKTQGEVVFKNDEIREMSFKREPLTDAEKQPIAAPVREQAQATENPDAKPGAPQVPVPQPPTVMQATLQALEAAIEADDLDAIGEILALGRRT